jgi:hypothetical protein
MTPRCTSSSTTTSRRWAEGSGSHRRALCVGCSTLRSPAGCSCGMLLLRVLQRKLLQHGAITHLGADMPATRSKLALCLDSSTAVMLHDGSGVSTAAAPCATAGEAARLSPPSPTSHQHMLHHRRATRPPARASRWAAPSPSSCLAARLSSTRTWTRCWHASWSH